MLGHQTWPNLFATWSIINFPNFKLCQVILWRKNRKLFSSPLGFKELINEVKITNPKDVYLPHDITNNNLWWKLGHWYRIIPPYVTGTLKHLMYMAQGIQNIQCFDSKNWIMSSMRINMTVYFLCIRTLSFQLHDSKKNITY